MRSILLFILIVIFLENSWNILTQRTRTILRIKKVEVDPLTYTNIFPIHYVINQYNYEQFVTGYFKIIADVEAHMIKVDRCDLDAVNCRYLNTYNFTQLNSFANAKNRPWSNITHAIHPRIQLPNPKKGWYTIVNATADPELLTFILPDSAKHYWKVRGTVVNKDFKLLGKLDLHYTILQFIERRRSKFN